jgi:hypothetical protein
MNMGMDVKGRNPTSEVGSYFGRLRHYALSELEAWEQAQKRRGSAA